MPTDTTVNNLVINKLTKAQYDAIQNPSDTELYLVPDVIDSTPTSGSDNMVTSGGVYDALSNKADTSDIPTVPTALSAFTDDLGSNPTHTHSQYLTSAPVTSVNGQTGAVTVNVPVTSVNGQTGAVSLSIPDDSNLVHITGQETIEGDKWFTTFHISTSGTGDIKGTVTIDDMGGNGKIILTGDAYPWAQIRSGNETLQQALDARNNLVTSVNGMTGAVSITIPDVPVTSVNGQTGAVNLTIPAAVTESTVSGWGFTKNGGTVTSTGGTTTINNIQVVAALPASPDANTLYLIPES